MYDMLDRALCMDFHVQDEAMIWWNYVTGSTFVDKQPKDVTCDEFRTKFDGKYFLPDIKKRKERKFQTLR